MFSSFVLGGDVFRNYLFCILGIIYCWSKREIVFVFMDVIIKGGDRRKY